jgi:ABC-type uncharacterized transport system ATPase subunit
MQGITKQFPGVLANDHIDFDLRRGEVHGLLGENGAGKSTLMCILSGLYRHDEGKILIEGKEADYDSPRAGSTLGIGMVYQHFALVPTFTVVENLLLGLNRAGLLLRPKEVANSVREMSKKYGLEVDSDAKISQLSIGQQQRVEILRILLGGAKILILDEPTSVLSPVETDQFFNVLRSLASEGRGIIFISHKLEEAFKVCDRITVLRQGRKIGTFESKSLEKAELVKMLFGEGTPDQTRTSRKMREGAPILTLSNVVVKDDRGNLAVRNISLELYRGEILGVAGVEGNGQKEFSDALYGLRRAEAGAITFEGKDITNRSPREINRLGIGHVTEDRMGEGIVPALTVAENAVIKLFYEKEFRGSVLVDTHAITNYADEVVHAFDVKTPSTRVPTTVLSGGNIQRLIIGRELLRKPKVLIASQPTHGLDAKTTQQMHQRLLAHAANGAAIIVTSSDLDEIFALSDTIAVFYRGEISGIIPLEEASRELIGRLMVGVRGA